MAEELVVKEVLSESMIKIGSEITKKLDQMGWQVAASLWFYVSEENQWRLILASPNVSKQGPKQSYRQIQKALKELYENSQIIEFQDIYVVDVSDHIVSLMRIAVQHGGNSIHGIRLSKSAINGNFIDDAFIYKMQAAA